MSIQKRVNIRKSYFINSAAKIIEEKGIEGLTVKEVTSNAGYNSSTLYNYFEDFNHLILLASMTFVKDYTLDLERFIKEGEDSLLSYLKISELFAYHSFRKPEIFHTVFYSKIKDSFSNASIMEEYYNIFPEDFIESLPFLSGLLLQSNIFNREKHILMPCVKDGYLNEQDLDEVSEIHNFIHMGMLVRLMNDSNYRKNEDLSTIYLKYTKNTLKNYLKKNVDLDNYPRFENREFK